MTQMRLVIRSGDGICVRKDGGSLHGVKCFWESREMMALVHALAGMAFSYPD